MKRIIALCLTACMLIALSGCSALKPAPTPAPTEMPVVEPTIAPIITPEPTPVPYALRVQGERIAAGPSGENPSLSKTFAQDPYTYTSLENKRLKVRFLYPEGWTSDPTTEVITLVEPVEEGDVAARFSITSLAYPYKERDITQRRLKEHLSDYAKSMLEGYNEYQLLGAKYDKAFAESGAIYTEYVAVQGNSFMKGIVMVGYGKNGRVYCMHFSCEEDDYDGFADLIERLRKSVTPTAK